MAMSPTRTILVVEDDPDLRYVLGFALKLRLNLEIESASNGVDALKMLRDRYYDLLITDMRMPFMGGKEFVARVARDYPALPIIVMSGVQSLLVFPPEVDQHIVSCLTKPLDIYTVRRAVTEALSARVPATEEEPQVA